MVLRILVLSIAQAFDLATFRFMVAVHGPASEANPLVRGVLESTGLEQLVVLKIALVALVASLAIAAAAQSGVSVASRQGSRSSWLLARTWAFTGGMPMALAIALGIIGGITNTAVILH